MRSVARLASWIFVIGVSTLTSLDVGADPGVAEISQVSISGCTAAEYYVPVPYSEARALVPIEFTPSHFVGGFLPAALEDSDPTAILHYLMLECANVQLGETLLHNQRYLEFAIVAKPVNPDWSLTGTEYFLVEAMASSANWVGYLELGGIPATTSTFAVTVAPSLGGMVPDVNVWQVSHGDASFTMDFRMGKIPITTASYRQSLWVGPAPLTRVFNSFTVVPTLLEAGTLTTQGSSPTADLAGPATAGDGSPYSKWDGSWTWTPGVF